MPVYKIRLYNGGDTDKILELINNGVSETIYGRDTLNLDRLKVFLESSEINSSIVLLMYADDAPVGVLVGVKNQPFFFDYIVAQEQFWYVHPDHRGHKSVRLVEQFLEWAKFIDANKAVMSCFTDKVGALYEKLGFTKTETVYIKDLK